MGPAPADVWGLLKAGPPEAAGEAEGQSLEVPSSGTALAQAMLGWVGAVPGALPCAGGSVWDVPWGWQLSDLGCHRVGHVCALGDRSSVLQHGPCGGREGKFWDWGSSFPASPSASHCPEQSLLSPGGSW